MTMTEIVVGLAKRRVRPVIPLVGTALIAWLMMEGAIGDFEISQRDAITERAWEGELESQDWAMQDMNGFRLFRLGRE